jgi:transposase
MKRNEHGRYYVGGKATDTATRTSVINLYSQGHSFKEISEKIALSKSTCWSIVKTFQESGSLAPKANFSPNEAAHKTTVDVLQCVEYMKRKTPTVYDREIRQQLIDNGTCTDQTVPSVRTINRIVHRDLGMSRKIVQSVPAETETARHDQTINTYFAEVMNYRPQQMHFFDEASVIKTAGNRKYGHSPIGETAVEVQRYASSATYTVNLVCGYFQVDHFDIIQGPSNALEMYNFFTAAIEETNAIGNPVFAVGDVVVMDNCGFHHHRQMEPRLRALLRRVGVSLLFQPPYSPEYNVCEYMFRAMRHRLRENPALTFDFTELAITQAICGIPDHHLPNLFRTCGYV